MSKINFLDFNNMNHLYDINVDSVKNTDDINTKSAAIYIYGIGNNINCENYDSLKSIVVKANIEPIYSKMKDIYLDYDDGINYFKNVPIFPLTKQNSIISSINIVLKEIVNLENYNFKSLESFDHLLFKKDFQGISNGSILKISSKGLKQPIYTQPFVGVSTPLYSVGGYYHDFCNLSNVENIFIFPMQKNGSKEISIEEFSLSEIISKDPEFAFGSTEKFSNVQGAKPWNLVHEIENGKAILKLLINGQLVQFKSISIEKNSQLSGEVFINFIRG